MGVSPVKERDEIARDNEIIEKIEVMEIKEDTILFFKIKR